MTIMELTTSLLFLSLIGLYARMRYMEKHNTGINQSLSMFQAEVDKQLRKGKER